MAESLIYNQKGSHTKCLSKHNWRRKWSPLPRNNGNRSSIQMETKERHQDPEVQRLTLPASSHRCTLSVNPLSIPRSTCATCIYNCWAIPLPFLPWVVQKLEVGRNLCRIGRHQWKLLHPDLLPPGQGRLSNVTSTKNINREKLSQDYHFWFHFSNPSFFLHTLFRFLALQKIFTFFGGCW